MVLLAGLITAAAYVLASLGRNSSLPAGIGVFLVFVLGLLVLAHVAVRMLARGADPMILPMAAFLHGLGWVMVARLSARWGGLQATWSLIGVGAFVATLWLVPRIGDLRRHKYTALALGIGLLLLPMVPGVGFSSGGARIWVSVGPVNFQPGEFAKILLAVFFAAYLDERRTLIVESERRIGPVTLPEPRHLAPVLVAWGMSVVIMVGQRDLGSSLLFFTLFVVLLWLATEKTGYLVVGLALFAAGAVAAYNLFGHVRTRVTIWLDPWPLYETKGYQNIQALFGLANGGMTGTGLGLGSPQMVPASHNDFIFSSIGEELGLMGATAVLAAFVLLVGAGMRTALRTTKDFEKLLAAGLTTILGVQAFIIVGGVLRVVPLTGVTLPFMSYGGSSLVANYVLLALLVRISDATARELREVPVPAPAPAGAARAWARAGRRQAEQRGQK
jgi:peptidoglycan glycosyltransferase